MTTLKGCNSPQGGVNIVRNVFSLWRSNRENVWGLAEV